MAETTFDEPLSEAEPLAKFLYVRKGHFRIDPSQPTWRAFLPKKEEQEVSVFRTTGLREAEVWDLAATSPGAPRRSALSSGGYDLPWNPNRIEQRIGRIHRIGRTEVCHLWNLLEKGAPAHDAMVVTFH